MKQLYSLVLFLCLAASQSLLAQPVISLFSPASGPVGTTVTITGTGFSTTASDNIVHFGAVKAVVSTSSTTSLTVTVPIGATYAPITVTTGGLTASSSARFILTFPGTFLKFSAASFEAPVNLPVAGLSNGCISDFDGDGKADIGVVSLNTQQSYTLSFLGNIGSKEKIAFAAGAHYSFTTAARNDEISIIATDIDGDGLNDIVLGVPSDQVIEIFRNISTPGNISFTAPVSFTALGGITGFAVGDLDGDGKTDIAIGNNTVSKALVFRNTSVVGNISLSPKIEITDITGIPQRLAIGDLDGDSKPELVAGYMYNGNISYGGFSILRNTGAPGFISFAPHYNSIYFKFAQIRSLSLGDLDGDGKLDILTTDSTNKYLIINKNTSTIGNLHFVDSPYVYHAGTNASIADLDGDGNPDVAISGDNGTITMRTPPTIDWFNAPIDTTTCLYTPGLYTEPNIIADMDCDGKPDIVSLHPGNGIDVTRNKIGESTITPSGISPVSSSVDKKVTVEPTVQSYNSRAFVQRHYDIEPANNPSTSTAAVTLYFSQQEFDNFNAYPSHGAYLPTGPTDTAGKANLRVYQYHGSSATSMPGTYSGNMVVIDPTDSNIVWNSSTLQWQVTFNVTGFSGFFISSDTTILPVFVQPSVSSFSPTFGNIGTTVAIAGTGFSATPSDNIVYFGAVKAIVTAATTTSLNVTVPTGATYQPITVTINGLTASSQLPFVVTFPGAFAQFSPASFETSINLIGKRPEGSCTGDFDGDGKVDIAITERDRASLQDGLGIFRNTGSKGNISFAAEIKYLYPVNSATGDMLAADIDGDGLLDIAVNNPGKQQVWVFRNTSSPGNVSFANPIILTAMASLYKIAAGDLDGDGKTDIVVSSITISKILIFKNTSAIGTVSFNPKLEITDIQSPPRSVTIADLDGDNKPDLVMGYAFSANSEVSILKNSSNPGNISFAPNDYLSVTHKFGIEAVSIGDIDGDMIPDLIVADSGTRSTYILKNSGTAGQYKFVDLPLTYGSGFNPLLTDLDGDKKVDFAASSITGVVIAKNNSEVGNIAFSDSTAILSTPISYSSICSIADFDGDGKPDIAAITNNLFILRNKIGESTIVSSGINPVTGEIDKKVTVDPVVQSYNGQAFVQRHYDIEPSNNPSTATATVTLYFSQQEFDNFNTYSGHGADLPTGPTDNTDKANLRVYQYHGFSTTSTPGTYSGSTVVINPDDNNIVWNTSTQQWEVTFDVTGFSGFFVGNQASALPLKLLSFTAIARDKNVALHWSTTNEVNTSRFDVQRSTDGSLFTTVATIKAAGNSSAVLNYQYVDTPGPRPVYYYRLNMVDIDGHASYSDIAQVTLSSNRAPLRVYPNPARDYITIEAPSANKAHIRLLDLSGQVLQQADIPKNNTQTRLSIQGLASGTYKIIWTDGTKTLTQSLLIL